MKNKILFFLKIFVLSVFFSLPLIVPYLKEGFFTTHDGEWAVVRLADMFRGLRDGQFPVRYSGALNFGYGYPLFNFAYPLPYYLGILIYFFLGGFVLSVKVLFVLSIILSFIFMYFAASKLWKSEIAGFICAVLYIYFPYRIVDLFVRGSIGESISFAIFPIIFYLCLKLDDKNRWGIISFLAVSISFLITTHNIMTVIFMPLISAFTAIYFYIRNDFRTIKNYIYAVVLGLLLASFFWIPAIFEKQNVLLSEVPIANRDIFFVNPIQLFEFRWGYGSPEAKDGFTYQLGYANILVIILSLVVISYRKISKKKILLNDLITIICLVLFVIYAFLLFKQSYMFWKYIPLLSEINYPWVVLSQLGFLSSLLAGYLMIKYKYRILLSLTLILISFTVIPNAKPVSYVNRGEDFYITNEDTTTSSDELMPLWVDEKPSSRFSSKVELLNSLSSIENLKYNSREISFDLKSSKSERININTIYYPGWRAYENSSEIPIDYNNKKGTMTINSSKINPKIVLVFSENPLRFFSNILSILGVFILICIFTAPKIVTLFYKK